MFYRDLDCKDEGYIVGTRAIVRGKDVRNVFRTCKKAWVDQS